MRMEERLDRLEAELRELKAGMLRLPLQLMSKDGERRIEIVDSAADTAIKIYNSEGRCALSIGVDGTGSGYISLRNQDEKVVAKLDVEQYGARLELLDNFFGGDAAVVIHGNDCDNAGGWLKVLADGDAEVLIACPVREAAED